ncbi:uncharacterized protein LOC110901153 [Helianthus annuus]|uniref:uncharacterized protein LOC110901153 n=1 Tax=Helianthus annuus TaxID=4232 RepID=UPI000B8F4A64|nr:uncharacterized protein LOC110901153 [Helianthus annuus]
MRRLSKRRLRVRANLRLGSCNDINVFEQFPFVEDYIFGRAAKASFNANGNYYPHGYYLSNGIYPRYSIVVKKLRDPYDEKRAYFKKVQEYSWNDIERCFGVLQQRKSNIPEEYPQATMEDRVKNAHEMRSEAAHNALGVDLVENVWSVRHIPNEGEEESDDEEDQNHENGKSEDEN